jgi:hypothetical protein
MSVLTEAIQTANARKTAGLPVEAEPGSLIYGENQDGRLVFSGFDIDYDELLTVIANAGSFFTQQACTNEPLIPLFRACWTDAFLVGLMAGKSVAPHHDLPDPGVPPCAGEGEDQPNIERGIE